MTDTKKCRACGEVLPLTQFSKDGPLLYKANCKPCYSAQRKKWQSYDNKKGTPPAPPSDERELKERARLRVEKKVHRGSIVKPDACEECGARPDERWRIEAHHDDYTKPLEVRWLCKSCHMEADKAKRAQEAA
jgi:hypothetical protein